MRFSAPSLLLAAAVALASPVPQPPGIPSPATARSLLEGLEVSSSGSGTGYSRKKFPHWATVEGACNTREFVLQRDGIDVETDDSCAATSGTWVSPYDGGSWTQASDIDIDHMVPLKNAWISGASAWSTEKRKAFANDITRPQLWAVTDRVNEAKGDKSPDRWMPPLESFHCIYAKSWVQVKSYYRLSVTDAEKDALSGMLDSC
ncbi:secreted protein [Drechmeria coniospora]|uniref:Secreted protein n=1 Tax=Drechmeria coniospora TaxID=98403 RepID=A0A151GCI4_DRECN|nr:secreted protein [Drechmeria coniospora]KYK54819.1 secreted protein [Drechmeria coniospora]ODA75953.1 hypothetical protein RJ55_08594 [Drechmeria coniospora]